MSKQPKPAPFEPPPLRPHTSDDGHWLGSAPGPDVGTHQAKTSGRWYVFVAPHREKDAKYMVSVDDARLMRDNLTKAIAYVERQEAGGKR